MTGWLCDWMAVCLDGRVLGWPCDWMAVCLDVRVLGWPCVLDVRVFG